MTGKSYATQKLLVNEAVRLIPDLKNATTRNILNYAEVIDVRITPEKIKELPSEIFSEKQIDDLESLAGRRFMHRWEIENTLAAMNPEWSLLPQSVLNKKKNKQITEQLQLVEGIFKWE